MEVHRLETDVVLLLRQKRIWAFTPNQELICNGYFLVKAELVLSGYLNLTQVPWPRLDSHYKRTQWYLEMFCHILLYLGIFCLIGLLLTYFGFWFFCIFYVWEFIALLLCGKAATWHAIDRKMWRILEESKVRK